MFPHFTPMLLPGEVILAVKGDPAMCWSANRMMMLYSPGAVGRYDTEHVPSLLSVHLISALEGPSTANANPPTVNKISQTTTVSSNKII